MKALPVEKLKAIIGYIPQAKGHQLAGEILILPAGDAEGLSTLEFIDGTGLKAALHGGKRAGKYWVTERLPAGTGQGETILIGEGAATICSAVQSLPGSYGVAAFSCHNLKAVARIMRERFPDATIIVLADVGNGQSAAETAAKDAGCLLAVPEFPAGSVGLSDFNDLAVTAGTEEVKRQIKAAKMVDSVAIEAAFIDDPVASPWSEPVPLPEGLSPVKPLDPELIPEPLRPWLLDIAGRMEIPPDFSTVAAMTALSSLIGRGCGIYPKEKDNWLVVPNTFGGVIGRPSLLKSPAIAEAMKPLDRLEIEARDQHKDALQSFEINKMVARAKREEVEKGIKQLVRDGKEYGAESLKSQLAGLELAEPFRRRFFTADGTPEKIIDLLNQNPRGILIRRDELIGWLRGLDKDGREGARALFLEGWNGTGRYSYDTISRGTVDVEGLTLSVFGAITPGPLQDYVYHSGKGGGGDDGLLQRFQLLVWPDGPADWKNVDRWPDTEQKNLAFAIFKVLAGDIPGAVMQEGESIPSLRFSPGGQAVFNEWRQELERRLRGGEVTCSSLESHLGKYRSLMPSLALIIHLVDVAAGTVPPGPVSETAALMAVGWCEYLESHAVRIYGGGQSPAMESARELLKHIKRGNVPDGTKPKEIYRREWSKLNTAEAVRAGLKVLEDYDWLLVERTETGGRPSEIIRLNPLAKI